MVAHPLNARVAALDARIAALQPFLPAANRLHARLVGERWEVKFARWAALHAAADAWLAEHHAQAA